MALQCAIILHAWDESPESCWYSWLKKELEKQGVEVVLPAMPEADAPKIEAWVATLQELLPSPDDNTLLIGHSVGCQTILRYLMRLDDGQKIGRAVFVAPWTHLVGLSTASQQIAQPWIETPIGWEAAKAHCPQFFAFFSDNDPWVPTPEEAIFKEKLTATTQMFHQRDHFDTNQQFPELLEVLF